MSELKAKQAYFSEDEYERGAHKICAKVSNCGYDRKNDWWSYAFEDEVYLKSEADKVIAELKKACNDKDDWCLHTLKELRHHKYKRCLEMAKYCEAMRGHYLSYEEPKWFWYRKWSERWLELAEKFKEAK